MHGNNKKVLYTASVVKTHIMQFHVPVLKLLKEFGFTTYVAAKNDYDNLSECLIPYCDHFINIDFARSPFSLKNIKALKELKELINKEHFDIIHCHTPTVSILTRIASRNARKKGSKVIYTAHGFHFYEGAPLLNWFYYPIEKHFSKDADIIAVVNEGDYKIASEKFHCKKIIKIPGMGIDCNKYLLNDKDLKNKMREEFDIPKDAFVLISVGELQEIKNHRLVIEALNRIKNSNIYYLIAGQGRLYNEYTDLINSYNLKDYVKLLGYRNDIPQLLNMSDVIVHPSTREGLGLAAIEGMAAGLPLISSAIHGMKDYVENNKTGITINPYNVDEMVSAINKIYVDKKLRSDASMYNKEKAKEFDIKNAINTIRKLYE